jgi:hypothetical protein
MYVTHLGGRVDVDVLERVVDAAQLAVLLLRRDQVLGLVVLACYDKDREGRRKSGKWTRQTQIGYMIHTEMGNTRSEKGHKSREKEHREKGAPA